MLANQGDDSLGWEKLPQSYRDKLSATTRGSLQAFPEDWPEVEFLLNDAYIGLGRDFVLGQPQDGKMYASFAAALITPFSRGNVTIASADTNENPIVNPNILTDHRDQELIIAAFKRLRDLFATEALKPVIIGDESFPGKNVTSDAEILEAIRQSVLFTFHASATCKMGRRSDRLAVVDS